MSPASLASLASPLFISVLYRLGAVSHPARHFLRFRSDASRSIPSRYWSTAAGGRVGDQQRTDHHPERDIPTVSVCWNQLLRSVRGVCQPMCSQSSCHADPNVQPAGATPVHPAAPHAKLLTAESSARSPRTWFFLGRRVHGRSKRRSKRTGGSA